METFDTVIVGAGIAGASLAWRLVQGPGAPGRVLLLEREAQPGLHATGRSAAMYMASYGPPAVRALTRASRAFYQRPPAGFAATPLLAPRGALYVAAAEQLPLLQALHDVLTPACPDLQRLSGEAARARVPVLRPEASAHALLDTDAQDIDVHVLHQGFLRGFKAGGGVLRTDAELLSARPDGGGWRLTLSGPAPDASSPARTVQAGRLVNAAGAWADVLAQRCGVAPLGLQPRRRSAFTFRPPEGLAVADWPALVGIAEDWYIKPDAGRLLGSPANADDMPPHDVQPEALDIALAIHRIETATTLRIRRPEATWAGLRTFAPDGEPVIGADPQQPAFFWLAGQGGYGIQSAAGAAELAAALLQGRPLPEPLAAEGVHPAAVAPGRFRMTATPR